MMKIGDRVIVARQTALFRHPLSKLDPSFVDGRIDGEGSIVGFVGSGKFDFLVVRIGANTWAYVEEEVSKIDKDPAGIDYNLISQQALDDAVHGEVSKMGSSINNEGRLSQVCFLKERGWSDADFSSISSKTKTESRSWKKKTKN